MNSEIHNAANSGSAPGSGEETLRLIASLPAPAGLEDRVHAALDAAPRSGRVLAWPMALRSGMSMENGWMRAAAAAAIVFVVAGGGWGVYSRVQPGQPAKVIVMPSRMPASGGFSGAGAIRTPQTLPGPMVSQHAKPKLTQVKSAKGEDAQDKGTKKPTTPAVHKFAPAAADSGAKTPN